MNRVLKGVTVLEVATMTAGPLCAQFLAALGADVIKVEPPGTGDPARLVPPFAGPAGVNTARQTPDDVSISFMRRSRGKKSVTLNLKDERGRKLFLALAKRCDILVENLQPGAMQRLGLDYESVRSVNPGIVYASISGFGQTGPYSDRPAYDAIIQAMSGLMAMTGSPDGPPIRANCNITDILSPAFALAGILAALLNRDRTGTGQHVDVAMLDCMEAALWDQPLDYFLAADLPIRSGNRANASHPQECYPTKDGSVMFTIGTQEQWTRFSRAMGAEHLVDDPRFASGRLRVKHSAAIDELIGPWARSRTTQEVVGTMLEHDVPCGRVSTVADLLDDPHLKARGTLSALRHPRLEQPLSMLAANFPVHCSEMATDIDEPAPILGMHNEQVFQGQLGLSADELARLRQDGIV